MPEPKQEVPEEVSTTVGKSTAPTLPPNAISSLTPPTTASTMEVHHPHHLTHQKKWSEYLLEFLMLFLAVYLGFVAENFREHSVERHRENEYIHSLIADLKTDTTKLGANIRRFETQIRMQQLLMKRFSSLDTGYTVRFFANLNSVRGYPDFIYTDGTIQQLKNSGGFRLLRKAQVVDSIMAYDADVKKEEINETTLGQIMRTLDDGAIGLFSMRRLDAAMANGKTDAQLEAEHFDPLLTHDRETLEKYYNQISLFNSVSEVVLGDLQRVNARAKRLIAFLESEYD